jgi:hypothetical protein
MKTYRILTVGLVVGGASTYVGSNVGSAVLNKKMLKRKVSG